VAAAAQRFLCHRILIKIHFGELGQTVGVGMNSAKLSRDCETNSVINFLGDCKCFLYLDPIYQGKAKKRASRHYVVATMDVSFTTELYSSKKKNNTSC
jgi:hypothetical protein